MLNVGMNKYNPSLISGACIYTSLKFNNMYKAWEDNVIMPWSGFMVK